MDAFKKEPVPVTVTAGRGSQPPRIRTAVAMGEPEESKTPVPFPFWEAFQHNGLLRKRPDTTYDEADENELLEPVSTESTNNFLLKVYDAGLIKPQSGRPS